MKFTIPKTKRKLNLKDVNMSKEKILNIIKKEVKSTKGHFKLEENGGWKLDRDYIVNDILRSVLGFDIGDEINQELINQDMVVEYTDKGSFIKSEEGYHPIYMNVKTGKIVVVEDEDNKDYLFKYSERNGYEMIGKL